MKGLVVIASFWLLFPPSECMKLRSDDPKPKEKIRLRRACQAEDDGPFVESCFEKGCNHWLDTDGNKIEAHGAGMLFNEADKRWYWYGESKKTHNISKHGVNCYSSPALGGPWRFEGQAFSQEMVPFFLHGRYGPWIIERPKVLYNKNTSKFVMWFHLDSKNINAVYDFRHAAVATSTSPTGPFEFIHALWPDGIPSLDMSLWKDVDEQAYFIRSCNNEFTGISGLTPDYLDTTGLLSIGPRIEGMALFRHPNGTLYMMSSHLTGWNPNPLVLLRSDGPNLTDPRWTSLGNPTNHPVSYNSQPTYMVPHTRTKTYYDEDGAYHEDKITFFIYMADNWINAGEKGLVNASYVWLPVRFHKGGAELPLLESWSLKDPFFALSTNHRCQRQLRLSQEELKEHMQLHVRK